MTVYEPRDVDVSALGCAFVGGVQPPTYTSAKAVRVVGSWLPEEVNGFKWPATGAVKVATLGEMGNALGGMIANRVRPGGECSKTFTVQTRSGSYSDIGDFDIDVLYANKATPNDPNPPFGLEEFGLRAFSALRGARTDCENAQVQGGITIMDDKCAVIPEPSFSG